MTTAYIALGSNLGDRAEYIKQATALLSQSEGVEICRLSSVIETEALSDEKLPEFLNAVVEIQTTLSAEDLLKTTSWIEKTLGRIGSDKKWQSRTIDLDILLFGSEIIKTDDLTVPHSQMHLRSFVLAGMCELDRTLTHPVLKDSMGQLADRLGGRDFALNPEAAQLISVAGVIGAGKTTLAQAISERLGCELIREEYDSNPFLAEVYAGKNEFALDSEIFFLMSRAEQLNTKVLKPTVVAVGDYVVEKELIYAKNWLNSRQQSLYAKVNHAVNADLVQPVLVIYLQTSPQECMKRIHGRKRPYEQKIKLDFLQALDREYEKLFADWNKSPLFRIADEEFDSRDDDCVGALVEKIKNYIVG